MQLTYIAGKYSADTREDVQANIDAAEVAGKAVLLSGAVPVIPHRISAHWDNAPEFPPEQWTHAAWLERFCFPLLDRCDAVLMLPGWQESKGAVAEHQYASTRGKKILYMEFIPA